MKWHGHPEKKNRAAIYINIDFLLETQAEACDWVLLSEVVFKTSGVMNCPTVRSNPGRHPGKEQS